MKRIYTEQEIEYINKNYLTMTYRELASKLGRSRASVAIFIQRQLKNRISKRIALTNEEKKYIRQHYLTKTYRDIAQRLQRSIDTVKCFCSRHKLLKNKRKKA